VAATVLLELLTKAAAVVVALKTQLHQAALVARVTLMLLIGHKEINHG
jgi:hypothetical protein